MSTPSTIQKLLKCNEATANAISGVMYQYVSPDWSEASAASLRTDMEVVAELAGITIVKASA